MELNWSAPEASGGDGSWIAWDDGTMVGGIGLTGGGVFSVASHWDPDMLTAYDGMSINTIRFAPFNNAINSSFTLKVWQGANAGTLLYEEVLNGIIPGDWNEISLASPVEIDASQELWFGYTCDSPDGENPAGHDTGPAVTGYGDMITLDGVVWDPISSLGAMFNLNWNLQAYVADLSDGSVMPLTYIEDNTAYLSPEADIAKAMAVKPVSLLQLSEREIQGYNIFWNNDGYGYEFLDFTTDTFYTHFASLPFPNGSIHCYYVTSLFEDCESAASNEACWVVMGDAELEEPIAIQIYPNPARDILNIVADENISNITMMDYPGRIVFSRKVIDDHNFQLNVAGYETGIYLVKIETSSAVVVRKVTIAH
jgi:hypothetical protein